VYIYIYIYIYISAVKDDISFTLIYKFINNRHEDCSKNPKHVAESYKFRKCLIRNCVRLYCII